MARGWSRRGLLLGAGAVACAPRQRDHAGTILRIGIGLEPPNLDPTAGAAAAIDEVVYANVFEGLTRIGPDGAVRPALARTWEIGAAGRDYLFHLAEGARFHDGAPFTSRDVIFSLERARAETSQNAQRELFEPIETIAAEGAHAVRIRLKRPFAGFLFNLGWGDAVMVNEGSAAQNAVHPIGTGPFRFRRWARGAHIELEKNNTYWGAPAQLDGVRFLVVPDASAGYAALMAGDVDGFPDFPAPELLPLITRDPRFRIAIGQSEGETILAMNHRAAPFSDIRVRRALAHAVDRRAVIAGAMFGHGVPIGSHFSPAHAAYDDLSGLYPFDPVRARALLAQAGFPRGFETSLKLPPTGYARRGGEIIAAQLRDIGVTARIENVEWASWLENVFTNHDFELTIVSHTEPLDIGIYARSDYYFGYRSAEFDDIMARIAREGSETARNALFVAAQRRLATDAAAVYLFELPKLGVWRREVEGVWENAPIQGNDVTGVRMVRA